jgi:hypothetical protein
MPESKRVTEKRDVSGMSRVSLDGVGRLVITQGDAESLVIEADERVMPRITTRVEDGTLRIGLEAGAWWRRLTDTVRTIRFDLTMREVAGITLSGSGRIEASGISAERLDLKVSGAGNLRVDGLSATGLLVTVSGAGNCEVSGRVDDQEVKITGAGGYRAGELTCSSAKAALSGTGSITLNVEETLDATITGAGSIRYHGEPTVFQRITGVGSVRSLDRGSA